MPKLWNNTIEAHRQQVRAAVIAATTSLVSEHGLRGVTMSRIAEHAGIGRATLYKYFPDVESILSEWHHDQVGEHLARLRTISTETGTAQQRLGKVVGAFAHMSHRSAQHDAASGIVASLHTGDRLIGPEAQMRDLLTGLIEEAVEEGSVRGDVPAGELATYCLNAASGARYATSQAAVRRLIAVALSGLEPRKD